MSIIETIIDIPAEHERKVCGQFDSYLKKIERTLHVSMVARDGEIKVIGPDHAVKRAKSVFSTLLELSKRGEEIGEQNVDYALALSFDDKDTEMLSLDRDIICHTINGKPVKPKTLGQKQYIDLIRKKMIVFGVGPAGTGKTYLGMSMAIQAFKNGEVGRIILTRPAIEAGEKLGFLPGDLQEKVDPYLKPLYDALNDVFGPDQAAKLRERGIIEVAPLAYMRGRTLNNSMIIIDESQNATLPILKMALTRIGVGSKMILTGDVTQIDLSKETDSGLQKCASILKNVDDIATISLTNRDVVRCKIVKDIVKAFEKEEAKAAEKTQKRAVRRSGRS